MTVGAFLLWLPLMAAVGPPTAEQVDRCLEEAGDRVGFRNAQCDAIGDSPACARQVTELHQLKIEACYRPGWQAAEEPGASLRRGSNLARRPTRRRTRVGADPWSRVALRPGGLRAKQGRRRRGGCNEGLPSSAPARGGDRLGSGARRFPGGVGRFAEHRAGDGA